MLENVAFFVYIVWKIRSASVDHPVHEMIIKTQNLRLFLAYTGRKYDYSKASGLTDYNTDRIEIGMLYRLKAY